MDQPHEGQVEEVWIKTEPIEGESTDNLQIKCEEELLIDDKDPFTDTASSTVTEVYPETVCVEPELIYHDYEWIAPTENTSSRSKKNKERSSDKGTFKCDECGKEFPRKSSLDRHVFMHSGIKPFACDICGMRFSQKGHIKPHQRMHTGEKPYACNHCDMTFMYGKYVKRHMKKAHSELNAVNETESVQKIFECDECGEKFTRNDNFKWHKQRHAGDIPFECDECGKQFFRNDHLHRHKRMHTGEKPFECDICGAKFSQKAHIKPHKLTHSDERSFACERCDKTFACPSGLRKHKKVHIEIYRCCICNATFNREDSLVQHMKENHLGNN